MPVDGFVFVCDSRLMRVCRCMFFSAAQAQNHGLECVRSWLGTRIPLRTVTFITLALLANVLSRRMMAMLMMESMLAISTARRNQVWELVQECEFPVLQFQDRVEPRLYESPPLRSRMEWEPWLKGFPPLLFFNRLELRQVHRQALHELLFVLVGAKL